MPNPNRLPLASHASATRPHVLRSGSWAVMALILLATSACATSGRELGQSDHLTREELVDAPASNLYQAIELLRPLWLRARSRRSLNIDTEIIVVVNGTYYGTEQSLLSISATEVQRVRYEAGGSGVTAVGRVGAGRHVAAVISLEMYSR